MSEVRHIGSIDDPEVAFFRDLKGQHPRLTASGKILIEGEEQLRRALASGVILTTLFCESAFWESFSGECDSGGSIEVLLGERQLLQQIVGYRLHRGIMALAERPAGIAVPELKFPALALNAVTDPENVGNIARSAAAFGFSTLIFDGESSDPYSRRAIRVSMGGVFRLGVCALESLSSLWEERTDLQLIAVESGGEWPEADWPNPEKAIYVLGNEKRGIAPEILRFCSRTIGIEMRDELLSSVNVATAAGIVCSESFRRFEGKGAN